MAAKLNTFDAPVPWACEKAINEGFCYLSDAPTMLLEGIKAADPKGHEQMENLFLMEELAEKLEVLRRQYEPTWAEITEALPEGGEDENC